ncbi:hypothetical protein [Streptomyces sp. 3211]|uniref:hypothetical protein n=1 Tax=Streptomyces sp. 3211 TaxID=1964449 RepID=UPI000D1BE39C|nr:hypothetical protein [Streptomyces sp. 3211]
MLSDVALGSRRSAVLGGGGLLDDGEPFEDVGPGAAAPAGPVTASNRWIRWSVAPLGALMAGVTANVIGLHATILLDVVGLTLSVLFLYLSAPARHGPPPHIARRPFLNRFLLRARTLTSWADWSVVLQPHVHRARAAADVQVRVRCRGRRRTRTT